MPGATCGFLAFALMLAIFLAALASHLRRSGNRRIQEEIARRGVELEAEVLARYEAGELEGSELAKARQSQMASWDPLEMELRYVLDGREIVSRRQVSVETFFRTRGMKTLKVKVAPKRPVDARLAPCCWI